MKALSPYTFPGRFAVVTGAASGIGEQLAHALAARGSEVVLLDRDADRLGQVAAAIHIAHPDRIVEAQKVDLADRDALAVAAALIRARHPRLGLLVNNAGIAFRGLFEQLTPAEFESVLDVNFRAPVLLTHALLPSLLASPGSHVVNVSSVFGLISPPGQSAYSSSKFALRGFSEVLRAELAGRVGVTTVYPGGVRTRIAENAGVGASIPAEAAGRTSFARSLTYPPERAAAEILDAVARRRGRLLITRAAKASDRLARLLPAGHIDLVMRATRR
jgi:short-subunit dehydrogenase